MDEAEFITAVSLIATGNECIIKEIDFKKHIINLDCPAGNDIECARALDKVLHEYIE